MAPHNYDDIVALGDGDLSDKRRIAYEWLSLYVKKRISWYQNEKGKGISLSKLLAKDTVMFACRGVSTSEEFVKEAFHACESSSEETVMGNTMQAIIAEISADTLDTGDVTTARDGSLYVCELKSQANTVNSSSFPQELRELKEKCLYQQRLRRASNQEVLPAFCVLRHSKPIDEMRTFHSNERDLANRDLEGFEYRYLAGTAFWQWLTGFDSPEGLVQDVSRIDTTGVVEARTACLERLQEEMKTALIERGLGFSMNDVLTLKRMMREESRR